MNAAPLDLLVIGGGIQGVAVARDAAGRGWRVMLCERADLANATSSASSKLIHGGLRYLEHREWRLVRESLAEREHLLAAAPFLVRPLRFVLPHTPSQRPAWMVQLGLFLYDRLGGARSLPASRALHRGDEQALRGVRPDCRRGFVYSDALTDDARLVVLTARAAATLGADIRTRTEVLAARRDTGVWVVTLRHPDGDSSTVTARALVNATGPWAADLLGTRLPSRSRASLRKVKGSHVVVPRLTDSRYAFTLQNDDGRVVFVIPYEQRWSLVGTTDVPVDGDPGDVACEERELRYLSGVVARFLTRPLRADDVVWSFAGVRPLIDDGSDDVSTLTRDDVIEVEHEDGLTPLATVFGGKLTTHRRVAERVLEALSPYVTRTGDAWTAGTPLPGALDDDNQPVDPEHFAIRLMRARPWLDVRAACALVRRHGSGALAVIGDATSLADLGPAVAPGLYAREVEHMLRVEWARTPDDVLWRRSKAGLGLDQAEREAAHALIESIAANLLRQQPTPAARPGGR